MKWFIQGREFEVDDCTCDASEYHDDPKASDHSDACEFRKHVEGIEDGLLGARIEMESAEYVWGDSAR